MQNIWVPITFLKRGRLTLGPPVSLYSGVRIQRSGFRASGAIALPHDLTAVPVREAVEPKYKEARRTQN